MRGSVRGQVQGGDVDGGGGAAGGGESVDEVGARFDGDGGERGAASGGDGGERHTVRRGGRRGV